MSRPLLYKLVVYLPREDLDRSQSKKKLIFLMSALALLGAVDWNILLEH